MSGCLVNECLFCVGFWVLWRVFEVAAVLACVLIHLVEGFGRYFAELELVAGTQQTRRRGPEILKMSINYA
jgi:hypothetical protein